MIGALIGAGISAAGSIVGGMMGARSAKKAQENLEEQQKENQAWYDRRYNEDPTQRASAQRMITLVTEDVKKRNKAAQGTQAVIGGTEESVAATKEANNKAIADTVANIAAQGDAQKDAIEAAYNARKSEIAGQQLQMEQAKTQALANATAGVAQAAGGLATGLEGTDIDDKIGNTGKKKV